MNSKFLCCILAAMIPTTFLSCSKQEESDRSAPVIKTVGRIVAAKPEGGLYDIGYTLTDTISGASVKRCQVVQFFLPGGLVRRFRRGRHSRQNNLLGQAKHFGNVTNHLGYSEIRRFGSDVFHFPGRDW